MQPQGMMAAQLPQGVMMLPQGAMIPQGAALMQPGKQPVMQPGMQPGMQSGVQDGGVQYMPCIVPMKQAMQMAQSGNGIPMGEVGPQQMQNMMSQQSQQYQQGGMGGGLGYGTRGSQSQGGQGGYGNYGNNYGPGKTAQSDDNKLDDWLSKRFGKNDSSSSGAARGGGHDAKPDQQARKSQQQMGQSQFQQNPEPAQPAMMQQQMQPYMMQQHARPPMGMMPQRDPMQQQQQQQQQQQMQQQQMQQQMQIQQMQFQQQQQQLQQQMQQQQMQQQHMQQQVQLPGKQAQFSQQMGNFQMQPPWVYSETQQGNQTGHGGGEAQGAVSQWGGDSPRTAAWKAQVANAAKAAIPKGDTDDWIAKRSKAGPAQKAKLGGENAPAQQKDNKAQEERYQQPAVDFQVLGQIYADERPWADIVDEDRTAEELRKVIESEEGAHHDKPKAP